ncbi:MAG: pyrroloquinoline quinone biosynthesis protein PqqE [Methanomassiliicoccales archaeon PtaU1.Bin124]|nr:MAG: pyrroloquinoline quinone biosynthesis protein PqqE [Methanomassiliicoccales archaeon PtaU1.Bin124]
MTFKQWWRELYGKGLRQGVYKFDGTGDLKGHRFHLRVDSASTGSLLVDASSIIFLNGTALDYVRCALEDRTEKAAVKYMRRRYKGLDRSRAAEHFASMKRQLTTYLAGKDEILRMIGPDKPTIGKDDFPAPYRMDLALTYRCQNKCSHCYNEPRELKELTVEQWKQVIDKTWDLGIPHIVFTGGEPTLFDGLADLVARSELHGQVTGLVTNGRSLAKDGYLHDLVVKGLDHVQITVLSSNAPLHDRLVGEVGAWKETIAGLKVALQEKMYVSTNTTIMRSNLGDLEATMRFLISLGVEHVAFNGIIRSGKGVDAEGVSFAELTEALMLLKRIADENHVRLIWYTPTPYHELNPINFGLGIKQCTACSLNMAVEPDGTVLPCQSFYEPLGNILGDPWEKIWDHDLCKRIRERRYLDGKCPTCGMKDVCGGGCPLAREHGDYICLDRHSSM